MQLHPYHIDQHGRKLFACYYEPDQLAQRAVLFLYPTGQDYMRWHRAYHQLAMRLCALGCHVLKFDYTGTGDSEGELLDVSPDDWVDDIRFAAKELASISGVSKPGIFASRLSCLLVARAFAGPDVMHSQVWLDPVLNGEEYLTALRCQQREILKDLNRFARSRSADYDAAEMAGYRYSSAFLQQLSGWQSAPLSAGLAPKVLLSNNHYFASHAKALDLPITTIAIDYGWDKSDNLETVAQPGELLQHITSNLD